MTKKKIITLLLATSLSFSALLYGCGTKDTTNNENDSVKEDLKDAGEDAKNSIGEAGSAVKNSVKDTFDLGKNLADKTMDYSEDEFKKALNDAGLKVEALKERTDHFSVKGDEYNVNGQTITVYEYDKDNEKQLEDDLDTVTNNGTVVNGVVTNWNGTAHIYKKGRIVVVYEGDDAATLTNLKDILGNPIQG